MEVCRTKLQYDEIMPTGECAGRMTKVSGYGQNKEKEEL